MSLIGSLLAFVLIPLKARREERPKEVENLAVMALADEVKRLQFALDFWRESARALMAENERLREENRRLGQEEAGRQVYAFLQQQHALAGQHAASQQAMQNAALYNQGLSQYQYQGLGQQSMQQSAGCTCVPARARALGVHPAEPLPP